MRDLRYVVIGMLAGALLGGLFGALVVRPTDGDLRSLAHALVPKDFTLTYVDVEGMPLDGLGGGYTTLAATRVRAYEPGTTDLAGTARANGWRVTHDRELQAGHEVWLERPGVRGGVLVGGQTAGARLSVSLHRTHAVLSVVLPLLVGALVGGAVGLGAGRSRSTVTSGRP